MAAQESLDRVGSPANMAGNPCDELAEVIELNPPHQEGFSHPQGMVHGLRRAIYQARNVAWGQTHLNSPALPHKVVLPYQGHNHLFLVTEPSRETGVNPDEATNTVFKPGLTELGDMGSALRLHIAYAEQHPEQRVITKPTKGVSYEGQLLSYGEIRKRQIESIAAENLVLLAQLTRNGPIQLAGTSLGSFTAANMAEQNAGANPFEKLNIESIYLIASAVVANEVDEAEIFRDPGLDEDKFREDLTKDFLLHVPADFIRMARRNPGDVIGCSPVLSAYLLAPHKLASRALAIAADFKGVQKGFTWSALKSITNDGMTINVVGGAADPLIKEQIGQWQRLNELSGGRVNLTVLPGYGHLLTIDAQRTVAEMDKTTASQMPLAA